MTETELSNIVNQVLAAIRANSKTIGQLTPVEDLDESDCFEVSGGRRITYDALRGIVIDHIRDRLQDYETLDETKLDRNDLLVLTESAFEALAEKDNDKYYFTYED